MAIRRFTASDGSRWEVWEVKPTSAQSTDTPPRRWERRGQDIFRYTGPERRNAERRQGPPAASNLPTGYTAGWLVFESGTEKRRFAPPPADWEMYPDEKLIELWARSQPGAGFRRAG